MAELSSPFATLTPDDVDQILSSSSALGRALHTYERDPSVRFCPAHAGLDAASQSTWRLHAALARQMLQPLVAAYDAARTVAAAALRGSSPASSFSAGVDELELAFRGDARDAFVWLHCLLAEERAWCAAEGCPTCTATHALASESTIRALLTAALLPVAAADASASSSESSSAYSSADDADAGGFSSAAAAAKAARRASQPDFSPLLPALRDAVDADPFWGPYHYSHLLGRARRVARAVAGQLARQVAALGAVLEAASPPSSSSPTLKLRKPPPAGSRAKAAADALLGPFPPLIPVRAGAVARRQRLLGVVQRRGVEMALRERRMAAAVGGGAGKWTVPVACRWTAGFGVRPRSLTAP